MAERVSTALNVSHEALEATGAYDRFVDIDSLLHVDPHLLRGSLAPEMVAAADTLDQYWRDTVIVVQNIFDVGDRFWREAVKRFTFREPPHVGLGYARDGTTGSAVGRITAEKLVNTAQQIVRAGVTEPKIFELVGLLEPGIGPDLISDITIRIIEPHLLEYTERVCHELGVETKKYALASSTYSLPANPADGEYLALMPRDVLRDLPVAFSWSDVDKICAENEALRVRMNQLIGDNWRRATQDNTKEKLKQVLVDNPAVLTDLLEQYRRKPGQPYDFAEDILGETIWLEQSRQYADQFPLNLTQDRPVTPANILTVVRKICDHFRQLVENNGLSKLFWTEDGKLRHERFAQLLFFGIADAYCKANGLDLSPETNSGRGPVDFKISKGYEVRVLVEVKWSTNSKLAHGFETQLEEYKKAEKTDASILLVIQVSDSESSINRIHELQGDALRNGEKAPEIKVVDGRIKKSASHFGGAE